MSQAYDIFWSKLVQHSLYQTITSVFAYTFGNDHKHLSIIKYKCPTCIRHIAWQTNHKQVSEPKYTPLLLLIHAWGHEKALKAHVYDYDDDHLRLYSNSDKWINVELRWIDTSTGKLKVFREKTVLSAYLSIKNPTWTN